MNIANNLLSFYNNNESKKNKMDGLTERFQKREIRIESTGRSGANLRLITNQTKGKFNNAVGFHITAEQEKYYERKNDITYAVNAGSLLDNWGKDGLVSETEHRMAEKLGSVLASLRPEEMSEYKLTKAEVDKNINRLRNIVGSSDSKKYG